MIHIVIKDEKGNDYTQAFHTLVQDSWSAAPARKGAYATVYVPVGKGYYIHYLRVDSVNCETLFVPFPE